MISITEINNIHMNMIQYKRAHFVLIMQEKYLGSKMRISPASVPNIRQLLAGSFHESLRMIAIAVRALALTSGILLYCSAKLNRKLLSIDRNFNVRGERNDAPSSFSNSSKSSASVSTFNSSSNPHLCQIYIKLLIYSSRQYIKF